jgi:hypothetical protein
MVVIWNYYHFKKWNTEFTRNQDTFKFSYLFKNDKQKNMSWTWTTIYIYYNKFEKKKFKFICMEKLFLGKQTCNPFLK